MLGMKRLNANVNYCLTVADGLSNELFNLEIWPDVPTDSLLCCRSIMHSEIV